MNEYGSIYGMTKMSKEEFEKCKDKVFNEKATHSVVLDTVMLKSLTSTDKRLITFNSKFIDRYGNMSVIDKKQQKLDGINHSLTEKIKKSIVDSVIHSSVYAAGLI